MTAGCIIDRHLKRENGIFIAADNTGDSSKNLKTRLSALNTYFFQYNNEDDLFHKWEIKECKELPEEVRCICGNENDEYSVLERHNIKCYICSKCKKL